MFRPFDKSEVSEIILPSKFTFPFYYEPHPLAVLAAEKVQNHIHSLIDLDHNFGLDDQKEGLILGKMFGVLVVQNQVGELGFLAAFSGKLANDNHHEGFVPPVFDMLTQGSFFLQGEIEINEINAELELLENSESYLQAKKFFEDCLNESSTELADLKSDLKKAKKIRDQKRLEAQKTLPPNELELLTNELIKESLDRKNQLKKITESWELKRLTLEKEVSVFDLKISELKNKRKALSNALQQRLFKEYKFLNILGDEKSLLDIFKDAKPPAGSGECAAPKLLQYAFEHEYFPICMAEFWWGACPKSEIRKHQQFYPACNSKCEPILGHMLKGLNVDDNPFYINHAEGKELKIIYEDEYLLAIDKPAEFLSVPGKKVEDSAYWRMKNMFPDATGPLLVHRLDMSTSGILLVAKTKDIHELLQRQFIKRSVKKRYVALLDGELTNNTGVIDLPIRVDLDDRPRQLVCYEHGKKAKTMWELISVKNGQSKVYFYPITGRTHQLRVHAAHVNGLGMPIVGDDLYGMKSDRLHLHAEELEFTHPISKERITIHVDSPF